MTETSQERATHDSIASLLLVHPPHHRHSGAPARRDGAGQGRPLQHGVQFTRDHWQVVAGFGIRMGLQPALDAPHIIVTTPTGQLHEIGAVLVSTLAAAAHWRVTYMGANLPADDIAVAAHHNDARAVALSIVYPLDDPCLGRELIKLRQALGDDIYLFVGGRAVPSYSHILQRIDAIELNKLSDLRPHLHELQLAETRR